MDRQSKPSRGQGRGGESNIQPNRARPVAPPLPAEEADAGPPLAAPAWDGAGSVVDRRLGVDRREIAARLGREGVTKGEEGTGLERRRGPGRRRTDFTKAAEEGELTGEQFLFVMAIDAFKKANGKMFPTWTDVLEVVRLLGYRKTMPSELSLNNAEDWREPADTPSGVRTKPGHREDQRDAA